MDIVLIVEQVKWVTQEVAPPIPNEFSTQEEKDAHYQWQRVDEKAYCIVLRPAKQATLEEKNLDLSVSQVRIREEKMVEARDYLRGYL
ncbi:hypothetical protein CK203_064034 [Vitis vinifera]|uniref:Uncharacterized protein n=1 Tax=Vitis vinifera TaxID=29760 RepID=A0A438G6D0_VITVI|nr:hypothetical protein CK203_065016 [Vitis vinifera]RVW68159.1 hypothetical protein CK203_064034 [Vitis vinifera]